ncbi:MAG: uroporphyrinogen decarboxylase family protein [Candidatus Hydrogenedentes bacterium]|nr:uroporphyrinogen decarboxylase family protein [Candidatus Hydrogenedentota bacterium]
MTNRERVLATLRHEQPDFVPYNVEFTQKARAVMVGYFGHSDFETALGNCLTLLDTNPANAWTETAPNVWRDPFGVLWDRSVDKDIGVVCNSLVTPENVHSFELPDPNDSTRYEGFPKSKEQQDDRFIIANLGFSLFERAWTLAGMENVLMGMVAQPEFVHALLDRILEFNLAVIDRACKYAIDAMYFGDDWGSQRGLLMGRDLWRKFILPRARCMYSHVKKHGKFVFIHSCGKVDELFPDLIDAGIDVFNPFQPEVIDVFDAKARYGDRLCFHGGISTQQILPYATPHEVRTHVRQLLERVGENGGLFASPAHAVPGDARPENVAAMLDVLQNQ